MLALSAAQLAAHQTGQAGHHALPRSAALTYPTPPHLQPVCLPTGQPSVRPTTSRPTSTPTRHPTLMPVTKLPSNPNPTREPSATPTYNRDYRPNIVYR